MNKHLAASLKTIERIRKRVLLLMEDIQDPGPYAELERISRDLDTLQSQLSKAEGK